MLKAIIFDVDGVLIDSREANVAMYQNILKAGGYPPAPREEILKCFHIPLWYTLEKLTGISDQVEIKRLFEMAHDASVRSPELFEFPNRLEEVLEELHKKYRLAIVTSRIRIGVEEIFGVRELRRLFDVIVTFEDYENPKPHPEPLHVALDRLKLQPEDAIYIGDSKTDIEAAKTAGMKSIHLSRDKHPDATSGIQEFHELMDAIDKIG